MISLDGATIPEPVARTAHDPVHFSDLVCFADSPAHFRAALNLRRKVTPQMLRGTLVHQLVLGPHRTKTVVLYEGEERKGKAWADFKAAHKGEEIALQSEWDDAKCIADAVLADPVARLILDGARREVGMSWESGGIKCETDGVDIVNGGIIGDLKITHCTQPRRFSRHAIDSWWHAQLAFYEEGANANGITSGRGLYAVGVEPVPPYAVTVLKMPPETIEHGRKSCVKWLEKLRACRDNDHWPAYTQTVESCDLPEWMQESEDP